jgi:serine/threonine protein phosphatase 1
MLYLSDIGVAMKQNGWKSVLRLEKNKNGRDFVCGDIHGCFSYLEEQLIEIGFSKNSDRLFCVGDLIDRGPESRMAADYIEMDWFYSVLGNHEEMFLMSIAATDTVEREYYIDDHIRNGGGWAYKNSRKLSCKIKKLFQVVDKLPLVIQVGDVIIAHAAVPAVQSLKDIETNPYKYLETILWERKSFSPIFIPGISKIYVGHTIVTEPTVYGITTNIDTGAFMKYRERIKGKLTVLEIGKEIL